MIRIAIVEDDVDVRYSMEYFLSQVDDIQVAGSFSHAEDLMNAYSDMDVDVVLMDISLPGMNGIDCVSILKAQRPEVQFLMCSVHQDQERTFAALCAGATGYLIKNIAPERIISAIREIASGGSPMSPQIARYVIQNFREHNIQADLPENLTQREVELLQALTRGYLYKEIADQMNISVETVRTYVRRIYEKLHVHTRTDAVNRAFPRKT
ncbi:MAG TPA: response regulator transcription factor [Bacteroidales bacterium]|nr:response regulator transcription factor [Bacteroidales bacterium]HRZ48048.1 response regulator transcription factor [Bacteroidales bacterium]